MKISFLKLTSAFFDKTGAPAAAGQEMIRGINELIRRCGGISGHSTVADLGDPYLGARSIVTDANSTTFASIVAAGGSNVVPVYGDGSDWRIG